MGTGSGTAWNTEQQNIGDRENRAGMEAVLAGINQGNTEFNQGMGLHTTGVNDILRQRHGNLEQSKGLLNMNPQVTMPQFQNTNVSGPGNSGNLMQAGQLQYNASRDAANAKNSGGMGGLLGLAGNAVGSYFGVPGGGKGNKTAASYDPWSGGSSSDVKYW